VRFVSSLESVLATDINLIMDTSGNSVDPPCPALTESKSVTTRSVRHGSLLWRTLRIPFWLFCHLWLRLRVSGREHLELTRGGLLLVNHQSFLDPLLVAVFLGRPVSYLARDSLFRVPVLGWILRKTHVIPISREAARGGSIRVALERLENGFLVGIFPEGTRSPDGQVHKFRPGFLALARRTQQPIYPVGIVGADHVMPRGALWIRPGRIQIVFGTPLTVDELRQLSEVNDDAALSEMARSRVEQCTAEAEQLLSSSRLTNAKATADGSALPK
jgi:1-acyl-sn-glycerol-3-phosphate acyltransferase